MGMLEPGWLVGKPYASPVPTGQRAYMLKGAESRIVKPDPDLVPFCLSHHCLLSAASCVEPFFGGGVIRPADGAPEHLPWLSLTDLQPFPRRAVLGRRFRWQPRDHHSRPCKASDVKCQPWNKPFPWKNDDEAAHP